ncbi:hypothetical protein Slin15195_G006480 [Septoria linicola]|uniref:NTF2-like domain-containing protein n=1 Tax=Septoria linicola TaxID=215465 RepID=A0A9Q9AD32_9PEZI|nr:hypothetical protein Slin15195_G006480 [Septoria linicola]
MHPSTLLTFLLALFSLHLSTAQDLISSSSSSQSCDCLTNKDAQDYVADYSYVLSKQPNYRTRANARFKQDFKAYSDSYAFVYQNALNTTNTHTLNQYLKVHKIPEPAYETLFLSHTCDTITWYSVGWMGPNPATRLPIRRMKILFVDLEDGRYTKVYNEQNSAAMLYAMGSPECEPGWQVKRNGQDGIKKELK